MFLPRLFASRIPAIGTDGVPAWHPLNEPVDARVLSDGSFVLHPADMENPNAPGALTEWAQVNGYSMHGIDPAMAITALVFSTIVNDRHFDASSPVSVRIDASYVAIRLVEVFDRTETWEETEANFHRRTNDVYR